MVERTKCAVRCCLYVADATIDEFPVCALHDHGATRGILDRLLAPAAFVGADGRPMVLPVGPLTEGDFVPRQAALNAIHAVDCPHLAAVPDGQSKITHAAFDLTR